MATQAGLSRPSPDSRALNTTAEPPHIEIALAGAERTETRAFGYGEPPSLMAILLRLALLHR